MGIIDILKGIERLAVELLLWFIYIPKTIYKIIKDPSWVPGYVHEEMSKDDKFKGYLSPVLLFLGISVVLFVLLDSGIILSPTYDQKSASIGDRIQDAIGLLFLTIPLFFALFTEIFRKGGLQKEALLQNLYVQCYYLSPVMLSLFAYLMADQFEWESTGTYISISETPLYLFSITLFWFIIVQVRYISNELKYKKIVSLGIVGLWLILIAAGLATTETLFSHEIVDTFNAGEAEELEMTLPKDDEYTINVMYGGGDYTISLEIEEGVKVDTSASGLKLMENQYYVDTVEDELRFYFNASKGDFAVFHLKNMVIDSLSSELGIHLYTKKPENEMISNDPTLWNNWELEYGEEEHSYYLSIYEIPENGKYHLIIENLLNIEEEYEIGFYRSDSPRAREEISSGKISFGNEYSGWSFDKLGVYYDWKFAGKRGEKIKIHIAPGPDNDIGFDVVGSDGESVVPIDRSTIANAIHWLYVIFFGYVIVIGFRAFFKSSKNMTTINENEGSKLGRIIAIVVLVFLALFISLYFLLPIIMAVFR